MLWPTRKITRHILPTAIDDGPTALGTTSALGFKLATVAELGIWIRLRCEARASRLVHRHKENARMRYGQILIDGQASTGGRVGALSHRSRGCMAFRQFGSKRLVGGIVLEAVRAARSSQNMNRHYHVDASRRVCRLSVSFQAEVSAAIRMVPIIPLSRRHQVRQFSGARLREIRNSVQPKQGKMQAFPAGASRHMMLGYRPKARGSHLPRLLRVTGCWWVPPMGLSALEASSCAILTR